jgi:hypothetical protein
LELIKRAETIFLELKSPRKAQAQKDVNGWSGNLGNIEILLDFFAAN